MNQPTPRPPDLADSGPLPTGLCVCADDYAASESVSQAIEHLLAHGCIHATSVMVCSPLWPRHALRLQSVAQAHQVGLHLDWTSPFAHAAGHGLSLPLLMAASALRGLSESRVRAEIERQLDAFERVWQGQPAHIDGHQHIHQFPVIRDALCDVLARRYGSRWPWLRESRVRVPPGASWTDRIKAAVIGAWGATALAHRVQAAGQPMRGPLLGVYDFDPTPGVYAQRMGHWLAQATQCPGAVLMVHPALRADSEDPIGPARSQEWLYLSGPDWRTQAARHDVISR